MPLEMVKKIKEAELKSENIISDAQKKSLEIVNIAKEKAEEILKIAKKEIDEKIEKLSQDNQIDVKKQIQIVMKNSEEDIKRLSSKVSSRLTKAKEFVKRVLFDVKF